MPKALTTFTRCLMRYLPMLVVCRSSCTLHRAVGLALSAWRPAFQLANMVGGHVKYRAIMKSIS